METTLHLGVLMLNWLLCILRLRFVQKDSQSAAWRHTNFRPVRACRARMISGAFPSNCFI